MNKFLAIGRRLTRDILVCLGGILMLTTVGSLAFGNWGELVSGRFNRDIPEIREMFRLYAMLTIPGIMYLVGAYGISKSRQWAEPFVMTISALTLLFLLTELRGSLALIPFGGGAALILIWGLAGMLDQGFEKRKRMKSA